jgi:hypothetical protein
MITHAHLLELLHYNPETGIFTRLTDCANRLHKVGAPMNRNFLHPQRSGKSVRRTIVCIDEIRYAAGRLAWFYVTGAWPPIEVDHRDNDGWNQRWINLRLATRSQNQANTRRYKSNTSGYKNVFRSGRKARPWRVTIQKDGHRISIGRFETEEAANLAAIEAAKSFHGEFSRTA